MGVANFMYEWSEMMSVIRLYLTVPLYMTHWRVLISCNELFTLFKIVYQIKYYNDIIRNLLKLIYSKLYKSINNVLNISSHLISLSKCDFFSSVLCLWTVIQTVPFVKMNGIKCEMCTYNRGRFKNKKSI